MYIKTLINNKKYKKLAISLLNTHFVKKINELTNETLQSRILFQNAMLILLSRLTSITNQVFLAISLFNTHFVQKINELTNKTLQSRILFQNAMLILYQG